jgi:4-amino-4-deoxy-L-arabinose transferase-like glycosyltransferase
MSPITSPRPRSPSAGRSGQKGSRTLPLVIALAVPALFFFILPPLAKSGLWDPYELNVADLARRVALNLHGATSLALNGADNSLPHLNDLGRPQLPFTSIALGFKLFGLHEWAGRLPLALWGLLGVLATYGFVARLIDRRAGVYAAIALTTMPLYFTQARIMLGDIVTMAAYAFAFGGLAVAVFDGPRKNGVQVRALWLVVALVGLAAGYESRGVLLGMSSPLLGIGIAWGIGWAARVRRADGLGDVVGALALLCGTLLTVGAIASLSDGSVSATHPADLNMWVGAIVKAPAKYPTFDFYIGHLAEALAPWSAFVPFAMGRIFFPPPVNGAETFRRESLVRVALLVGAGVVFTLHGYLAFKTADLIVFTGPAVLAAVCAVALRDYERGAHGSVAVAIGTVVLLGLFHHDFHELPEKVYQVYGLQLSTFPETFKDESLLLWTVVLVGFAIAAFFTWVERDSTRQPFDPKSYWTMVRGLRDAWDGLLALGYFAMVAGASVAGLLVWLGARTHAKWLPTLSQQMRDGILNSWWLTAFIPLIVIFGLFFATDVWLWAFGRARRVGLTSLTRGFEPFEELFGRLMRKTGDPDERLTAWLVVMPLMYLAIPVVVFVAVTKVAHNSTSLVAAAAFALPSGVATFLALGIAGDLLRGSRAAGMAAFATLVGLVLCFSYFPALANQLSPKEVFESYQKVAHSGEPLALFGVGSRTAAYYIGGQPQELHGSQEAFQWLTTPDPSGGRRFLAMKSDELGRLNSLYRERPEHQNLPVLDARSSQIMLAASSLNPGEKNENPFAKMILAAPPVPQHPMDVNMEDKLEILGYDLLDDRGFVQAISPGKKYRMRTYYKVLAPSTTEWESFIHIDGYKRRHNGDHKLLDGKYPVALWQAGDLLADEYEFTLEPNFSPGQYTLFFGLFLGDKRMTVKTGPQDGDNRINGGPVRVL